MINFVPAPPTDPPKTLDGSRRWGIHRSYDEVPPKSKNDMPLQDKRLILFSIGLGISLLNQILDSRGVILLRLLLRKGSFQEMAEYLKNGSMKQLGASISFMSLSTYLNLGLGELAHTKLIVELADMTVKYPKGIAENVLVEIGKFVFTVDFIILDMPEDIKMPLILGRPFLSTARSKINVYKRKITLRVGEERIIFTSVKPASSLIKRVFMLSLRERKREGLDLEC
ncbi:hypothetical protein Tco_1001913 [Tanacetum coccineum]|uniref:Reverse transcriptase domain-containing protein n=1 Tax=Tanacetum coccineum TaxID=301880 RepID=A0ABQ5F665_9ASTR